jgi:protein phosphatase
MTSLLLHSGAATDAGRVRANNEDSFAADDLLFVVADGMGGHQAGEVASSMAVSTLRDRLGVGADSLDVVVAAVVEANAAIFHGAHTNAERRGMGTTVTGVVVLPGSADREPMLAMFNVGDSRTYLLRSGVLRRATIDHSYVQELVATGHITEDEARHHPRRNIVTRALGIEPHVRVDTWHMRPVRGDRYLMCSDGLVDEVADAEIASILMANTDPQAAADALVAAANSNGGRDNTTVLVLDIVDGHEPGNDPLPDDLTLLPTWSDPPSQVDADPADAEDTTADLIRPAAAASGTHAAPARRRITPGRFLFALAVATIATVAIAVGAALITGDDSDPAPSTTVPRTSTTIERTTTTERGTTTTRPATSTTVPTTGSGPSTTSG